MTSQQIPSRWTPSADQIRFCDQQDDTVSLTAVAEGGLVIDITPGDLDGEPLAVLLTAADVETIREWLAFQADHAEPEPAPAPLAKGDRVEITGDDGLAYPARVEAVHSDGVTVAYGPGLKHSTNLPSTSVRKIGA